MVSSIERFHCIQDSQLGPNGVLYREVPLYQYMDSNIAPITSNNQGPGKLTELTELLHLCRESINSFLHYSAALLVCNSLIIDVFELNTSQTLDTTYGAENQEVPPNLNDRKVSVIRDHSLMSVSY